MTHQLIKELLGKVGGNPNTATAVARVLELHTPTEEGGPEHTPPPWAPWQKPRPLTLVCYAEGHDGERWPCPTVRVIAESLGVPLESPGG